MIFEQQVVSLILYASQQLGIMLAVGGQTIILVAYLLAMRDKVIDATEAQFARASRAVLVAGLLLIIVSGLGISAMHYMAGELFVLQSPAYLFKWILVGAVALFTLGIGANLVSQWIGEALAGGTWYALFFLHILAPDTSWENLLVLYGAWLGAFALCWIALVFSTRERSAIAPVAKMSPPAPKPPAPKLQPLPDIPSVKVQTTTQPPLPPLAQKPSVPLARATGEAPILPKPVAMPPPPAPKPISSPVPPATPKPPAPMEVKLMQPKILPPAAVPVAPVHIPMQKPEQKTSSVNLPANTPPPAIPAGGAAGLPTIRVMPKGPPGVK